MPTWRQALRDGLASGAAASVASSAALALLGAVEDDDAAAPTNATSHWLWGERATRVDGADARHTVVGYAIHHAASVFWATLYEKWFGADRAPQRPRDVVQNAAAVAALACVVDYTVTPRRLTPGFERRLSAPSLLAVYAAFAAGLAGATLARRAAVPPVALRSAPRRTPGRRAAAPADARGWPAGR